MHPLRGVRVIDAAEGPAAGYCSRLLALLGAEVLKLERPRLGDVLRRTGPFPADVPGLETSALHLHLNAGKRSVTIDAASATGWALIRRVALAADVMMLGDPRRAHRSLRADALRDTFPRIVVTSLTQFGSDGPRATWRGGNLIAMAASGYMSLNGDPDREPITPFGPQSQYQAGAHAALGIVAALRARDRDGEGDMVDVAAVEAAGFLTAGAVQRHALMHRPQVRAGPRPAGFATNRLYPSTIRPCADGYVHVHCHNRFHDLISVLMQEPLLATSEIRETPLGHADEIDPLMDRWLAGRTRADAVAEAQELRVPMAEVLDPGEALRLEHLRERGFIDAVEHPAAGAVPRLPAPWRDARAVAPALPRAPLLGEHNVEILGGELGLGARDLARLAAAGIV